jgi:hypothetical protein
MLDSKDVTSCFQHSKGLNKIHNFYQRAMKQNSYQSLTLTQFVSIMNHDNINKYLKKLKNDNSVPTAQVFDLTSLTGIFFAYTFKTGEN